MSASETQRHRAASLGFPLRQHAAKVVVLTLLWCMAAVGQVVPERYIVELTGEPAALTSARLGARFAAREIGFAARRAAVRQGQAAIRRAVAARGGTVLDSMDTVVNGLLVSIPDDRAGELLQIPGVSAVHPVHRLRMSLDHALPLHRVPAAWATLPLGQNSAGAGIKIGIIDTGIDVNHPAFRDPLPPVEGFPKVLRASDSKYTNAKIIVARNYTPLLGEGDSDADDHVGHGTGTSMVAAGGPSVGRFGPMVGVAPKAYIGNYKVSGDNGSTTGVIAKAIDDAVADGMDVINLSIGGYVTSYSDIDLNNTGIAAIENAVKAGVIVTVSSGNDGPGAGTIQNLASAPGAIAVGAIRNDRSLGFAVRIGGADPYAALPGDGPDPGQALSGTLVDAATVEPSGQACSPLPSGSVAGMVVLILRGGCTFETKIDDAAAGGALAVIIYNNAGTGLIGMSVGSAALPAVFITQENGADLKSRIEAAALESTVVEATLDFSGYSAFPARPDLVSFSSRGPNLGSALKPDLLAVGAEIVSATQNSYQNGELYDPSGYSDVAGTSYSAPLTAGAAAVLKAARPGLTVAQYRSLLINNAVSASAAPGIAATVQQAGAGILNLAAAVSATVAAFPTSLNFGTGPGAIGNTLSLTLSNVGTVGDTFSMSVVPSGNSPAPALSSGTFQLDPAGSQQISVTLDATGLAEGEYQGFLEVVATTGPSVTRIPYWFAVPGSTPAGISILYSDQFDTARTVASQAVIFRVVDAAGLPFAGSETPRAVVRDGGDATVRRTYRIGSIPGTYAVDVRTGTTTLTLDIIVGSVTQTVVIPVV